MNETIVNKEVYTLSQPTVHVLGRAGTDGYQHSCDDIISRTHGTRRQHFDGTIPRPIGFGVCVFLTSAASKVRSKLYLSLLLLFTITGCGSIPF